MNKLIMALAFVLTPFFSSFSVKSDGYPVDFDFSTLVGVTPKDEVNSLISCMGPTITASGTDLTKNEVLNACKPIYEEAWLNNSYYSLCNSTPTFTYVETVGYLKAHISHKLQNGNSCYPGTGTSIKSIQGYLQSEVIGKSCPPDINPEHTVGKDLDGDGEIDACYRPYIPLPENECGDGYYQFKVYDNYGEGQCVPVKCDAKGTSRSAWVSGSHYNNGSGTYCDGSCASSMAPNQNPDPSPISGSSNMFAATVTSTGAVCGGGHPDDMWFSEGNEDSCTTSQAGGQSFLSCPPTGIEAPVEPDKPIVDLEQHKLEEVDPFTLIPVVEVCVAGDAACEVRNLKSETKAANANQANKNNKLATDSHNQDIEAQQTTGIAIVKAINSLNQSNRESAIMAENTAKEIGAAVAASVGNGTGGGTTGGGGGGGGGGGDGEEGECSSEDGCSSSVELKQEPSDGLEGFWESEYEDGVEGMFQEKIDELKSTEFYLFLDEFKPQVSGGVPPMFNWCLNFGKYMNLGCHTLTIDPRVFPALKVFFLLSASFGCRRILFGG